MIFIFGNFFYRYNYCVNRKIILVRGREGMDTEGFPPPPPPHGNRKINIAFFSLKLIFIIFFVLNE